MPGKRLAQSNHRAHWALTKRLLAVLKENFPEMLNFKHEEEVVSRVCELYTKAEKAVLNNIIKSFDETPVFDYETY